MSGRKLRKEGVLQVKLVEPANAIRILGAATLKSHRHPFETWRSAYVTLRYNNNNNNNTKFSSTFIVCFVLELIV